jgi:peptidyl-prolyl cis-trans isomerase C
VNGAGVTLAEYQAELERYRAALGRELTEEDRQRVLDELIDQVLLSQAAVEQGFALDEAGLQARMDDLVGKAGGEEAFNAWLSAQGYDQESFRLALARAVAAAWMRDQLAETTSSSVEQVHARQILFNDAAEANQVLAQLRAGTNFTTLANEYDPLTGGELGWFPRGYLLHPELEAAAFTLQPGEISPVVQTVIGYHILQVVERSTEHPLAPDVRLILQNQAVQEWLQAQRLESEIEILGLN